MITFPYAARVLFAEGIGTINFLNGIVTYVILLTNLGIPLYAVKEVAKYQHDHIRRNTITVEIFLLSISLSLIGYVIIAMLGIYVPKIHQNASTFYLLSSAILFNSLGMNWFYQATENFKFITIRGIIFRTLSAVCLFLFVKSPKDINIYALIIVGSTVGNNIINFFHAGTQIELKEINIRFRKIFRHLKPAIHVFVLNLIISLYVHLNTIMVGFIKNEEEVGFFTGGTKLPHIAVMLIGSISTVLLPRSSHLLHTGETEKFNTLIKRSLQLIITLAYPIMVGLMVLATPLIIIFCGNDFEPSIPILLINAPVVFLISVTTLTGLQILYPIGKVNLVIYCTLGGAIANLCINFLLVPSYGAIGAAISTTITEIIVFFAQLRVGRKYFPFSFKDLFPKDVIIGCIAMSATVIAATRWLHDDILKLVAGIIIGVIVYFSILLLTKNTIVKDTLLPVLSSITAKFHKSKNP